jgi:hypothetical protein
MYFGTLIQVHLLKKVSSSLIQIKIGNFTLFCVLCSKYLRCIFLREIFCKRYENTGLNLLFWTHLKIYFNIESMAK